MLVLALLIFALALQPILARRQSRCGACQSLIVTDELIVEVDGEWIHEDCADDDDELDLPTNERNTDA